MKNLIIRESDPADLEKIQSIYAREVLHGLATFEEEPPSVEEMAARRDGVLALGLPYLVAERDSMVAGYAYANHHRPRPAYRNSIENSVYVAQELHGKGIGKSLLNALIERCERGSWRQMVAVIGNANNAGSIGLHTSLGFRHVGVLNGIGFKHGQWVDTVIMQRPLNEGQASLPDISAAA